MTVFRFGLSQTIEIQIQTYLDDGVKSLDLEYVPFSELKSVCYVSQVKGDIIKIIDWYLDSLNWVFFCTATMLSGHITFVYLRNMSQTAKLEGNRTNAWTCLAYRNGAGEVEFFELNHYLQSQQNVKNDNGYWVEVNSPSQLKWKTNTILGISWTKISSYLLRFERW